MPSQEYPKVKFKNPYLKVIKGHIVPACEIEKRQIKLAQQQEQRQSSRCHRLNGWLDHRFQSISFFLQDCFEKRNTSNKKKFHDPFDGIIDFDSSFSSTNSNQPLNVNNLTQLLGCADINNNMTKRKNSNQDQKNLDIDNLSIVGDLFIFSCSSSLKTNDTDLGYFSFDGSINTNNNNSTQDNSNNKYLKKNKKMKSLASFSKKVKFNLLHSMTSTSSFLDVNTPHKHIINHINIIENHLKKPLVDNYDDKQKITFAYLFGNLSLFATDGNEDEDENIDDIDSLNENQEDVQSFTVDFSSIINSEDSDALSYDITSL